MLYFFNLATTRIEKANQTKQKHTSQNSRKQKNESVVTESRSVIAWAGGGRKRNLRGFIILAVVQSRECGAHTKTYHGEHLVLLIIS